jgi:hypothetical protein
MSMSPDRAGGVDNNSAAICYPRAEHTVQRQTSNAKRCPGHFIGGVRQSWWQIDLAAMSARPVPIPGRGDDILDVGVSWPPAQNVTRSARIGNEDIRVSRPPRGSRDRYRPPGDMPDGLDQLKY